MLRLRGCAAISRCLLGALLLLGAAAHTNMVSVVLVFDTLNSYHHAYPQGPHPLRSTQLVPPPHQPLLPPRVTPSPTDGTDGDSTNVFRAVTNVDINVVWPEDVGDSEVVMAADIPESLGLFGFWCCLIALVAVVAVVEKQPVSARPCGWHSVHIASRK